MVQLCIFYNEPPTPVCTISLYTTEISMSQPKGLPIDLSTAVPHGGSIYCIHSHLPTSLCIAYILYALIYRIQR